ncbi:TPA: chemotaxis protein CheW [Legionella pneumophila]|nr:chemotaxis protein CheW [Legionella pneumophila]HAT1658437.1 chemotaxis protein CheW [Legionella pneumophila]HAT1660806.1 chemotaxis protein CheW [Legionella pneumophila]HAT1884049.1 chemotaxis protein CheW [Legionella pneumophila]HAT2115639.1 chemotaxis protein CheW [Legionella pneumophila]HAT8720484.1 chemotaxis protein CheW [Legionella pneumophila]
MNYDWQTIYKRLQENQKTLEQGWRLSSEKTAQILKRRAQILAEEPQFLEEATETIPVMQFELGDEIYAIELSYIDEVCPIKEITPLPGTPAYVVGIMNVHGKIMSVLDIKTFFEIPKKELTNLSQVIILRSDLMEFGILADRLIGLRVIAVNSIQPAPPSFTGVRKEYLKGVTTEQMVILDANRILTDPTIIVNESFSSS